MGRYWTIVNGKRKRTAAGNRHEYEKYQSSPSAIKARSSRNSARRSAIRKGIVHKGDGRDIHHSDGNPMHNGSGNLRAISSHSNRGKAEHSRLKRSARNKKRWGK